MKIFFVNNTVPSAGINGGEGRMLEILQILAVSHDVVVCSTALPDSTEEGAAARAHLLSIGVREIVEGPWNLPRVLSRQRFDLLFCEFWDVAEYVAPKFRSANPRSPVVVDTVDLHFVREEAGVKVGAVSAEQAAETRRRELAVYAAADMVINVTADDDEILRQVLPNTPTLVIPIIVPNHARSLMEREKSLFFVGNFRHGPNVDGIVWFGREVWPLIRRAVPDASLLVAGRNPPPAVEALALGESGVTLLGWIPETTSYLERAAVSIAPLRYGAGMKVKVTEALAHGVPVVATSSGVQGFGGRTGEHYRAADEPEAFALAVIDLLKNPAEAEAMGLRGQSMVNKICSPEAVGKILERMTHEVKLQHGGKRGSRLRFQFGAAVDVVARRLSRISDACMNQGI